MANSMTLALDDIIADASTASAALGTIAAGSDAVVTNFTGLAALVDELSAFALLMKNSTFYTPVGMIVPFGGSTKPDGWLLCDGTGYATTGLYADLFGVISTTYGSSGGFQVPDLRGRVIAGVDSTGFTNINTYPTRLRPVSANAATLGQVIGDARTELHTHIQNAHTHYGLVTPTSDPADGGYARMGNPGSSQYTQNMTSTTATNQNFGAGIQQNVQPTLMLNYIIKY